MSTMRRLGPSWLALSALVSVAAHAQDVPAPPVDPHAGVGLEPAPPGEGEPLPTGHPPIDDPHAGVPGVPGGAAGGMGEALPSGHPPVGAGAGEAPPGPVDESAPLPSGHPPIGGGAGGMAGMGGMGDAAIARMFSPPETATAEPDPSVPAGSIRIAVVDENDAPVADAVIQLGIMRSGGGDRDRVPATSGPDGTYVFEGLETGSGQAYRVNVLYEGATYSSTPFQLPPDSGYSVRVRRLPVAHDERQILQFVAQVVVELRDDRLHVVVQSQLVNIGDATYVFPDGGLRMRLPDGFVAFQSEAVMTDQHVEEEAGHGMRIRGSLPPGAVMLAWGFDVPTDGDELTLRLGNPFRTMRYRVISEAPAGLSMDVEGFPRTRRVEGADGQTLLATELQRRPGDEALEEVTIRLRGIPGPGPLRLIASGLALMLLLGGVLRFARRPGTAADAGSRRLEELGKRKAELLAAARALEAEHAAGEIGDVYRQKRRDAIVNELAGLLYREERLREAAPVAASVPRPKPSGPARTGAKAKGGEIAPKTKKKAGAAPAEKSGSE